MEALVAMLLNWLSVNTELDADNIPLPTVIVVEAEVLLQKYNARRVRFASNPIEKNVLGLYVRDEGFAGTIYILGIRHPGFSSIQNAVLRNPIFQERLLHELVHHVQHHSGMYDQFACMNQGEFLAYQTGGKFLQQKGVKDPLLNRKSLALRFSQC